MISSSEKKNLVKWLSFFKKSRILVVGDLILDHFIWGTVNRISPEAPVPVVEVKRESYMPGGSLNVANNIRTLGGTAYPCGVIGRDRDGQMLMQVIRKKGINAGGIMDDASRPTTLKTRVIAHSQQVVRFDREKSAEIDRDNLGKIVRFIKKTISTIDGIVIEDYGKGVIQPALLKEIVRLAKRHKKFVLVDPKEKHFPYYVGVTAITPNRKEAYGALENHQPSENLSYAEVSRSLLKKLKCEAVLMTLGEDGMILVEKNGATTKIPTAAREVYDVSGAGDTVIAVLSLALAAGASMREAAILSNFAAGVVVAKLGTATVELKELQDAILETHEASSQKGGRH